MSKESVTIPTVLSHLRALKLFEQDRAEIDAVLGEKRYKHRFGNIKLSFGYHDSGQRVLAPDVAERFVTSPQLNEIVRGVVQRFLDNHIKELKPLIQDAVEKRHTNLKRAAREEYERLYGRPD
jgi:hypothetical protein